MFVAATKTYLVAVGVHDVFVLQAMLHPGDTNVLGHMSEGARQA